MIGSYIEGDDDPTEFGYDTYLTPSQLLQLLISSDPINKQCIWLPSQALAAGWKFKTDGPFPAEKFGKPYSFPSFTDWFNWCGAYSETRVLLTWAKTFSKCICIGFLAEDEPSELDGKEYYGEIDPGIDIITKIEAIYPYLEGNGYKIQKLDEIYAIHKTDKEFDLYEDAAARPIQQETIFYVHASRVIEFIAPKKEMGRKGTSEIQLTGHNAIVEREMFRSVMAISKNLSAGVKVCRAQNKEEADYMSEKTANLSHLRTINYAGNQKLEDIIKIVIPEMKVDQFAKLDLIMKKSLASSMGISIRYMGEEDIATGLGDGGAGISHINTKFEIKEIQRHYKRPIEHLFYLMGKTDSEFEWNDPMVKDEEILREKADEDLQKSSEPNKDASDAPNNEVDVSAE
jgi:hypothetical protein